MLLMLTTYAVEVLYILHQIRVIMGNQDINKNWKSSKTSIMFTRIGEAQKLASHLQEAVAY